MTGDNSNGKTLGPVAQLNRMPLFSEFVEQRYLPFIQNNKRSWKVDRGNLQRHILPYLGSYLLSDITADIMEQWIETLRLTGLAPSSCFRLFWVAKYVLNCALRWGVLKSDAAFKCARVPLKTGRRPVLLQASELLRLLEMLKEQTHRPAANAIRLMLLTGASKSEILTARWEDVDIPRGVLATSESFTGRRRLIPLNNEAIKLIRKLPQREGVPWLFFTRRGTRLSYITRDWQEIRKQFGHPELRLQDLRHSFAGYMMNMGLSRSDLHVILGNYRPESLKLVRTQICRQAQERLA